MMSRAIDLFYRFLEVLLVFLLAGMTAMVFTNVVLRYGFNSGIDVSEELSRFFFVWLTFLGAVVAMRHSQHMGFDLVVLMAGPRLRRVLLFIANGMVFGICGLLAWGAFGQAHINATNFAPVTGLSMIWVFGVVIPASFCMGAIAFVRMVRVVIGGDEPIPSSTVEGADR